MKEIMQKYARFNIIADSQVLSIIKTHGPEILNHDTGGFYHTIQAVLDHILLVDISWLNDVKPYFPSTALKSTTILDIPENENPFTSFSEYEAARGEVNRVLEQLCCELTEEDLRKEITFRGANNSTGVKTVWEILIHIFNHQTHHRGQISQILDERKIENNYSNIIRV